MAQKSISQLDTISQAHNTDLFEVAAVDAQSASGYKSGKMSAEVMAEGLLSTYTYPTAMPNMQNKTITGALNQLLANFAPAYDDTETYAVGDVRTYNGQLYKCTTAVSTAETFDPTKWAAIVVTELSGGQNYSTSEQVIGTWFGETLYEKTIDVGQLPNNNDKAVSHGVSNLGCIVEMKGYANGYPSASVEEHFFPIPLASPTSPIILYAKGMDIHIQTTSDRSYLSGYITIRYTKSTS